jgi:hypothetical protein
MAGFVPDSETVGRRESGRHYNLNRYYDPDTGQYLSPDPIGIDGGLRTHAYASNPLARVDLEDLSGAPAPSPNPSILRWPTARELFKRLFVAWIDTPCRKFRKWLESIPKEARSNELRTDHVRSWVVPITDKDLYGPRGPSPDDIDQDFLGDCYLVATLSAVALRHPLLLKNLIGYDRISQRFVVGLYDVKGKKRHIQVTQLELEDNKIRNGGSTMDNTMQRKIVWPAVFETAYAKLYDSKPLDGLDQGYVKISGGGWPKDAMMAVTGSPGTEMKFQLIPRITRQQSINLLGSRVARALVRHRTITLWSVPEFDGRSQIQKKNNAPFPQDGLVDNHVYTVMSMTRSASLNWTIRLRNPWGTNMAVGEGKDIKSAYISVDLDTLVNTGGLQSFRVSAY